MTRAGAIIPPALEHARLHSMEQLNLIDSPREERFDRITRMACHVFGAPMSTVSLIDDRRQWFKSTQGFPMIDVPRHETVCQTTIARSYRQPDDPALVIEDASADPEFSWIPGIGGEDGIRFYAGYPLRGPGGHPVGTLCVYDTRPRTLDATQLAAFEELAAWVQRELEQSDDLDRAATMQRQLLPHPVEGLPGYSVTSLCVPAFVVGGDFYDHYPVRGGVAVTVADVMGKGLGAAILASAVRSTFRGAARVLERFGSSKSLVLDAGALTSAAAEHLDDDLDHTGSFVTLFHLVLDTVTGCISYVDAGHGLALMCRRDGTVESLATSGLPLGALPGADRQAQQTLLAPGDMLLVCSDGLLDLLDESSDRDALHRFAARHPTPDALLGAVRKLTTDLPPLDDVTFVAIHRDAP